MAKALRGVLHEPLLTTTVIQMEVAHHLVKRLGPVEGFRRLAGFLGFPFTVDPLDEELVTASLEEFRQKAHLGVGGRDATVLASMARQGSRELWTHDAALKRVPGLKVRDPAASAG